jgi:hypothetical protein
VTEPSLYFPWREDRPEIPKLTCCLHVGGVLCEMSWVNLWKAPDLPMRWGFTCDASPTRYDGEWIFDVYLPLWKPGDVTHEQLMALELMMLELARWR